MKGSSRSGRHTLYLVLASLSIAAVAGSLYLIHQTGLAAAHLAAGARSLADVQETLARYELVTLGLLGVLVVGVAMYGYRLSRELHDTHGMLHEVGARRTAEDTLKAAVATLTEERDHALDSVRAHSEFLATMGHDIKTPRAPQPATFSPASQTVVSSVLAAAPAAAPAPPRETHPPRSTLAATPMTVPPPADTPRAAIARGMPPPAPHERPAQFRALVVEDNPINQTVAVKMIERMGGVTDVAANGREALAFVAGRRYDIIFMDCHMPEMDGFEATAEIRRSETPDSRIPIVAVTAGTMSGERARCAAVGMNDFIAKPMSKQRLDEVVELWLGPSVAVA